MNPKRFLGKLCLKHPELNGERQKSTKACVGCKRDHFSKWWDLNREAMLAKRAEKYRANPEKYRAYFSAKYYSEPERYCAEARAIRMADPEGYKAKRKVWRKASAEKYRLQELEWKKRNPEKVLLKSAKWVKANPDKVNSFTARRRAGRLQATPAWANQFFIGEIYHLAQLRTKLIGVRHHVDHIVPLKSKLVCGLHNEFNLQVIPWRENIVKGNRVWPNMPARIE